MDGPHESCSMAAPAGILASAAGAAAPGSVLATPAGGPTSGLAATVGALDVLDAMAGPADGMEAPGLPASDDGLATPPTVANPTVDLDEALALARSLLPTASLPAVEYNVPVVDVQR